MSDALSQAAQLKPDIRLGLAISEFRTALGETDRQTFRSLEQLPGPNASDVVRLTEEINRRGSRQHRQWKPYGTRLQSLLSQVQALGVVGDTVVGGAQNFVASGVWAVVRLSLTVALAYLGLFDRVSQVLMRMGHKAAVNRDQVLLFPHSVELKAFACEYLTILVTVCRQIVTYQAKGVVAQLASSLSLDNEFGDAEARLSVCADLINDQITLLNGQAVVKTKNSVSTLLRRQSQQITAYTMDQRRARWLEQMRTLSPNQDLLDRAWRRQRKKGAVKWVFNTPEYRTWLGTATRPVNTPWPVNTPDETGDRALLVSGSLGSGKTVLMAAMVADLLADHDQDNQCLVAYVFCQDWTFKDQALDAEAICDSLTYQLIKAGADAGLNIDAGLSFDRVKGADGLLKIVYHLENAFPGELYVILDGLDNLTPFEIETLFVELRELVESFKPFRWSVAARPDSPVARIHRRLFGRSLSLSMEGQAQREEMSNFVSRELLDRSSFRELDLPVQQLVRDVIVGKAESMYLWAVLQIDFLFPRYPSSLTSESRILESLNRLPKGLDDMYGAAIDAVDPDNRHERIFQFVAAAARPLSTSEMFIALSLEPGSRDWQPGDLLSCAEGAAAIYSCTGGLMEVEEEDDTVNFIHPSVVQFLICNPLLNVWPACWARFESRHADQRLGEACMTYLDLKMHKRSLIQAEPATQLSISGNEVLKNITSSLGYTSSVTMSLQALASKWDKRPGRNQRVTSREPNVNIAKVVEEMTKVASERSRAKWTSFTLYARKYWAYHCDHLTEEVQFSDERERLPKTLNEPLLKIMNLKCALIPHFPWSENKPEKVLEWVLQNQHHRLFWFILFDAFMDHQGAAIWAANLSPESRQQSIKACLENMPGVRLKSDYPVNSLLFHKSSSVKHDLVFGIHSRPQLLNPKRVFDFFDSEIRYMPREEKRDSDRQTFIEFSPSYNTVGRYPEQVLRPLFSGIGWI